MFALVSWAADRGRYAIKAKPKHLPVERARNLVEKHLSARANVQVCSAQVESRAARDGPDARVHVGQVHGLAMRCDAIGV